MKILMLAPLHEEDFQKIEKAFPNDSLTYSTSEDVTQEMIDWCDIIVGNPNGHIDLNRPHIQALLLQSAGSEAFIKPGRLAPQIKLANASGTLSLIHISCQKTKQCVIKDDANWIAQKMLKADVIVFTTPVYYYGMSGQMKTMLDRANPLYTADYSFRDIYLLASAADEDESAVDGTITGIQGWISCFEKAELKGYVFAGGVDGVGAIKGHEALQKAYEMGKAI